MSASSGAPAPEVSMCSHVVAAEMRIPFALYATKRSAAYLCPECLGDAVERRLAMPGQQPIDAASATSFQNCDHPDSTSRACWSCLEAASAELIFRWARYFHTDKQRAGALRRVTNHWQRHYDPAGIRCGGAAPSHTTMKTGASQRLTASQIAEDRRIQRDVTRIANRRDRIRRERGFPPTSILGATGKQPERVVVVPVTA